MQSKGLQSIPCTRIQGVGKVIAEKLKRLDIHTIQDILFHLPYRYQDRTKLTPLGRLTVGEYAVIEGDIISVTYPKFVKTRMLCRLTDQHRFLNLRFFYINQFKDQSFKEGMRLRCFGEVRFGPQGIEMVHPEFQMVYPGKALDVDKTLTPIYPTTEGISQLMWRKLIDRALVWLDNHEIREAIPPDVLKDYGFPSLSEAIRYLHKPPVSPDNHLLVAVKHPFQQRLLFEELIAHRLTLLRLKKAAQTERAISLPHKKSISALFQTRLPFQLTGAQHRVTEEIAADLAKAHPMLRLVQGDVGSGKTVVAAMAVAQACENGYQSVVMAPTEILVEQHYRHFQTWFAPLNVRVGLLSGFMKAAEKKEVLSGVQSGDIQVVVGTHAVFQKEVEFAKLALVIVDEQHRFGVEQRATLREKGMKSGLHPHQLIMTATPIPRTLAMSIYADLDCSFLDELPPGRTPITTSVIPDTRREEILSRIRDVCREGRQAYWVCTLIEESDVLQCRAAEETAEQLRTRLPDLKVGLIHGRMKPKEKEAIMTAFKNNELNLLVATTVIEVGVDVPNASLMIIENAERLGLSQLHQLRGRVGRGSIASHCVLLYHLPLSQLAKERLAVMRETQDGFKIAERDLQLRGPGEVLGTRQTGEISLRIADLVRDSDLLPKVQAAAHLIMEKYPHTIHDLMTRWLGRSAEFGNV